MRCSVVEKLEISEGGIEDYRRLSGFHYRQGSIGAYCKIFALRGKGFSRGQCADLAGVIVYQMPVPGLSLRNEAVGGVLDGLGRSDRMAVLNKNVRCIGRVVLEPRFRGLGLGARLVRETMGLMGVAVVESLAVMGWVNPFFEKAGMAVFRGQKQVRNVQMTAALEAVGIEEREFVDAELVHRKIEELGGVTRRFIENQVDWFMQCYGRKRDMEVGFERVKFVLSRLGERPVYYVWFNPEVGFSL